MRKSTYLPSWRHTRVRARPQQSSPVGMFRFDLSEIQTCRLTYTSVSSNDVDSQNPICLRITKDLYETLGVKVSLGPASCC